MSIRLSILILIFLFAAGTSAQTPGIQQLDSLQMKMATAKTEKDRYMALTAIYNYYEEVNRDSALFYAEKELEISRRNQQQLTEILSLNHKGYQLIGLARYAEALETELRAFELVDKKKINEEDSWLLVEPGFKGNRRRYLEGYTHHIFAILMWQTQNLEQEILHFSEARRIGKDIGYTIRHQMAAMNLGRSYMMKGDLDSAIILENEALSLVSKSGFTKFLGQIYNNLGNIYLRSANPGQAKEYFLMGLDAAKKYNNTNSISSNYFALADHYIAHGEKDSALYYSLKNLDVYKTLGAVFGATVNYGTIYQHIYQAYELNGQRDSAYKYQGLALHTIDSLGKIRIRSLTEFQNVGFRDQIRLKNLEKDRVVYQNRIRTWFFIGGLALLLLLAFNFYRNNRQKHKAKLKIEKAYDELKTTQQQLIHAEKMASLGELTAGIAHEIQNPLNFVNNFSEVNKELIDEMNGQLAMGNWQDAKEIGNTIKENEEKITHHGKRADAIVKSMLQHSHAGSGKKGLTDINALADEYMRLAYHGLRARDNTFNVKLESSFDPSIQNIEVVPQDLGRVLLNLLNNALFAVDQKRKQGIKGYEPIVSIETKKNNGWILITVWDNGNGVPQAVSDKIFQPFFTTKPTGLGTGLGLSLSYDIIKAHGGEIKIDTREGEYAAFIINLPAKPS